MKIKQKGKEVEVYLEEQPDGWVSLRISTHGHSDVTVVMLKEGKAIRVGDPRMNEENYSFRDSGIPTDRYGNPMVKGYYTHAHELEKQI